MESVTLEAAAPCPSYQAGPLQDNDNAHWAMNPLDAASRGIFGYSESGGYQRRHTESYASVQDASSLLFHREARDPAFDLPVFGAAAYGDWSEIENRCGFERSQHPWETLGLEDQMKSLMSDMDQVQGE